MVGGRRRPQRRKRGAARRRLEGGGHKGQAAFVRADVSREDDVAAAIALAAERFGRLDCMVNNAGVGGAFGPITEIEVEDWDYTFAVLTRGVFLGIKHAARLMQAAGRPGSIVNTASIAGLGGGVGPRRTRPPKQQC